MGQYPPISGPFDHYGASSFAVGTAATQVSAVGARVDNLAADVSGDHQLAVSNVAGLLRDPMVAASDTTRTSLLQWLRAAVVGGAALRLWARGIEEYNRGIDGLNGRYQEAKARNFGVEWLPALPPGDLTGLDRAEPGPLVNFQDRYDQAERACRRELGHERDYGLRPNLDICAGQVARVLAAGPDDPVSVRELQGAGVLPPDSYLVFPSLPAPPTEPPLPPAAPRGGAPADPPAVGDAAPAEPTEDAQFDHFINHPGQATAVAIGVLPIKGALPASRFTTIRAAGRSHAWQVGRALEMYPSPAGLEQIEDGIAQLVEINDRVAQGGVLTAAERAYLTAWLEELGPARLAALHQYVIEALVIPADLAPAEAEVWLADQRGRYLTPVSDAITHLSQPGCGGRLDVAHLSARIRQHPSLG